MSDNRDLPTMKRDSYRRMTKRLDEDQHQDLMEYAQKHDAPIQLANGGGATNNMNLEHTDKSVNMPVNVTVNINVNASEADDPNKVASEVSKAVQDQLNPMLRNISQTVENVRENHQQGEVKEMTWKDQTLKKFEERFKDRE